MSSFIKCYFDIKVSSNVKVKVNGPNEKGLFQGEIYEGDFNRTYLKTDFCYRSFRKAEREIKKILKNIQGMSYKQALTFDNIS